MNQTGLYLYLYHLRFTLWKNVPFRGERHSGRRKTVRLLTPELRSPSDRNLFGITESQRNGVYIGADTLGDVA